MKKGALFLVGIFLLIAHPAFGDNTFRCGSNLVKAGASMGEVSMKCGEPMMKSVRTSGDGNVRSEVWYYNCGAGQFNHELTFTSTRLQGITRLNERGSGLADWQKN